MSPAAVTVKGTAATASLLYIYYYWFTYYSKKDTASMFFKLLNIFHLNSKSGKTGDGEHDIFESDSDSDISYGGTGSFKSGAGSIPDSFQLENDESIEFIRPVPSFGISVSGNHDLEENDLSYRDKSAMFGVGGNENEGSDINSSPPCIYLDYNGTTPVDQRVIGAMLPFLTTHFGNPSSSHYFGAAPKQAIVAARKSILCLLHPNHVSKSRLSEEQDAIIFTGCGTEADNLAIHLAIQANKHRSMESNSLWKHGEMNQKLPHIVTSNVEHPAIAQYLKSLEKQNIVSVTYVPVNTEGYVSSEDMIAAITKRTVLVTLMLANNESGALQPVKEVSDYCKMNDILFHTDAAQAVGKVSVALDATGIGDGVDMITIVGHKFGAPKGVACLYVKPGCLSQGERRGVDASEGGYLLLGGGQEGGQRAGTENVVSNEAMKCEL